MSTDTTEAPAVEETDVAPVASNEDDTQRPLVESELLVEDVSIDGMCGVY